MNSLSWNNAILKYKDRLELPDHFLQSTSSHAYQIFNSFIEDLACRIVMSPKCALLAFSKTAELPITLPDSAKPLGRHSP